MTRTPSDSPTELAARTAVLERAAHTALAQLDASSRPDDDGVRLAAEVLKRALRPDSARPAPPLACFWLQEPTAAAGWCRAAWTGCTTPTSTPAPATTSTTAWPSPRGTAPRRSAPTTG